MNTFGSEVAAFADKAPKLAGIVVKKAAISIFGEIIQTTPVWDGSNGVAGGQARGNWQASTQGPILDEIDNIDPDGRSTIDAMTAAVLGGGNGTDESYTMTNNQPYIEKLEFGGFPNPPKAGTGKTVGGFSTQAPAGMVRVACSRWEGYLDEAIRNAGVTI